MLDRDQAQHMIGIITHSQMSEEVIAYSEALVNNVEELAADAAALREEVKAFKGNPWTALTDHQLDWVLRAVQGTYRELHCQKQMQAELKRRKEGGGDA